MSLIILTDFNSSIIRMVSIVRLFSNFSTLFRRLIFLFQNLLCFSVRSSYLPMPSLCFIFITWYKGAAKYTRWYVFLLQIKARSSLPTSLCDFVWQSSSNIYASHFLLGSNSICYVGKILNTLHNS